MAAVTEYATSRSVTRTGVRPAAAGRRGRPGIAGVLGRRVEGPRHVRHPANRVPGSSDRAGLGVVLAGYPDERVHAVVDEVGLHAARDPAGVAARRSFFVPDRAVPSQGVGPGKSSVVRTARRWLRRGPAGGML